MALLVAAVSTLAASLGPGLDPEHDETPRRSARSGSGQSLRVHDARRSEHGQPRRDVGRDRGDDGESALLIPLHRTRASVERPGVPAHRVRRMRSHSQERYWVSITRHRRRRQPRASLDDAAPGGDGAASAGGAIGIRILAGRVRNQGGTGADAHMAARRPLRGAVVAVGDDVRCAPCGRVVRDRALESDHRSRDRLVVQRLPSNRRRPGHAGRGSLSLLSQTHFKRLLAFSSIEHMGLACLAWRSDHLASSRRCCT